MDKRDAVGPAYGLVMSQRHLVEEAAAMAGVGRDELVMIAQTHGLAIPDTLPAPWTGATSQVFPWGVVVIKIALDRPDAAQAVVIDARMSQVARRLGVASPRLIVLDESREIIPAPYAVFTRIDSAVPLQQFTGPPSAIDRAWRAVGRELARVHAVSAGAPTPLPLREFRQSPEIDPRPWIDELRARDVLTGPDADWLHRLLEQLAPAALADGPVTLCHGDVNAANVLVERGTGAFRSLIDWAGAGWLDPVWDFVAVPLAVVPALLAGHRAVAPMPDDATAERRIAWCQAQTRLFTARAEPDATVARARLARDITQLRAYAATMTGLA